MKAGDLPHPTLAKLHELNEHVAVLNAALAEAERELAQARGVVNGGGDIGPQRLKQARTELDALLLEVPRLRERARAEQTVLSNVKRYIAGLDSGARLEVVSTNVDGHDLAGTRQRLAAIAAEIATLERAPNPDANIEMAVRNYVSDLAAKGKPLLYRGLRPGEPLDIRWPMHGDTNRQQNAEGFGERPSPLLLAAWLHPERMIAGLLAQIAEESAQPIPPQARPQQLAALAAEARHLRFVEERLLCAALARNEIVTRSVDSPPEAVLQIRLANEQRAVA